MLFKPATGDYNTLFTLSLVPKYCCLDTLSAPRQERCMNSPFCYCKLPLSAALLGSQKFKVSFVLSSTTLFKQFVTARERKKERKKEEKKKRTSSTCVAIFADNCQHILLQVNNTQFHTTIIPYKLHQ